MVEQSEGLCQEEVYSNVFKEYSKTLYNYLYYTTGNVELSNDVTQEAFLKLWQNCKTVIVSTASSYVFTIAKNLLKNTYKHNEVVLRFENSREDSINRESPQYLLEEEEFRTRLEDAISALPDKQREVFLLSRIDKKTYAEIGEIIGISKKAVEKRMYLALDKLRLISKKIR